MVNGQKKTHTAIICLLGGILCGAAIGVLQDDGQAEILRLRIAALQGMYGGLTSVSAYIETFVKYQSVTLLMWLAGFLPSRGMLPPSRILSLGMVALWGTCLGYALALFTYSAVLFLPQNLIFVPTLLWLAHQSRRFTSQKNGTASLLSYILVLLCVTACAALVTWIEVSAIKQ